jgi:hypothetical protein
MSTTFVTAYLKIYDEDWDLSRTFENRLKLFLLILDLGINICIFIDPELQDKFNELESKYQNLKVIQHVKIHELELYRLGDAYPELENLSGIRHHKKDTKNYMYLMLSKLEFIKKTIEK